MTRPEAMLLIQAHTLDALFKKLIQRAHKQDHLPNFEAIMRGMLKEMKGVLKEQREALKRFK